MTIAKIMKLLPVPENVFEAQNHDWRFVYSKLGTELPRAYVEFLSIYGTGSIGDFLWILNPHSKNESLNLGKMHYFREAYQVLRQDFPEYYAREIQEFIPWGFSDNGDAIVWICDDADPNRWLVAIQDADPSCEELTNLTTSQFLESLLENRLTSSIFPTDFLEAEKLFRPVQL